MSTYRLAGKDINGIRYHSLFETNDLVKYVKDNKVILNAYDVEIWEMLPEQGTCLVFQMTNGNVTHGRELHVQATGIKVLGYNAPDITLAKPLTETTKEEAILALPWIAENTDNVVIRKHKVIKRAA